MCNGCGTKLRATRIRSRKHLRPDTLVLDGSYGEGGGQILRTALSLAALAGRAVRIDNIRSRRPKPGLAAQHLTAVRAAAEICQASVQGAALGSQSVSFVPTAPVRARDCVFDVSAAREGGSAGAATLVLQTVLLPLAFAKGVSHLVIRGGTHMAWSPSYEYVDTVWLPQLCRLGITATLALARTGWFPVGQGEITATIEGTGRARLRDLDLGERGRLLRIWGQAIAANLPAHIPLRMVDRARSLLQRFGVDLHLVPVCATAACPVPAFF